MKAINYCPSLVFFFGSVYLFNNLINSMGKLTAMIA